MNSLLRDVTEQDLATIREWRNQPSVMSYMFQQHKISVNEHKKWFQKVVQDKKRHLLIYSEDDVPLGFMQLHESSQTPKLFEWGFYISPSASKGTGTRLCLMSIQYAFSKLKAFKVYGEVLDFNLASIALHEKLGFKKEGCLRKQRMIKQQYHDVFCFGLLKNEQHDNS